MISLRPRLTFVIHPYRFVPYTSVLQLVVGGDALVFTAALAF